MQSLLNVRLMKRYLTVITLILFLCGLFPYAALGHPGSGIVVDKFGNVYFIHTGAGIGKISINGDLTYIHKAKDGHWMCLDEQGIFSKSQPVYFKKITPDGVKPTIIYAGGGSPIAVGRDGNFYYASGPNGDYHPGALTLVRENLHKQQTIFSPHLEDTLNVLNDGITGIAAAPDGSLYLGCWNSLLRVTMEGKVTVLVHPVKVIDCDEDPADHKKDNRGKPLLRGIAVDPNGVIYAAATGCHCVLKITADGKVQTILKIERPWSPTGIYVRNGSIYLLEYTNANGPATEGWTPRIQKMDKNGKITTLLNLPTSSLK